MRFKKWPQLPGAGRTRAGHHHGSHPPTSPEAILLGKMAHHTKQIRRESIEATCMFKLTNIHIQLFITSVMQKSWPSAEVIYYPACQLFCITDIGRIFLRRFKLYVLSFMFWFMFANIRFEKNQNRKIHVMFIINITWNETGICSFGAVWAARAVGKN